MFCGQWFTKSDKGPSRDERMLILKLNRASLGSVVESCEMSKRGPVS